MRKILRQLLTTAPMLWCALALICGAAVRAVDASAWVLPALLVPLSFLPANWRGALALLTLTGWLRTAGALRQSGSSFLRYTPREACAAEMCIELLDTPPLTGRLAQLDTGRGILLAKVLSIQCIGQNEPVPAAGTVALSASPELLEELRAALPGQRLNASGALLPLADADDLIEGLYGNHLRSLGVQRQFAITGVTPDELAGNCSARMRRMLRRLRIALAERLICGIADDQLAQALLALGLGMKEFIPRETVERQVAAGTVHVFAISGMHVGLMALLFAALFQWCGAPLRYQWLGAGFFSALYVLLTGASPSGMRALLMSWAVICARMRFRTPSWLNTIGIAGSAAILAAPLTVLNSGFIYSYSVVLALLLTAPRVRLLSAMLTERQSWLPRGPLRPRRRLAFTSALVCGLAVSLIAWLASLGIAVSVNPRLNLGAALVNLPLGVSCAFTLFLCPLKILSGLLCPWLDWLWAAVLSHSMKIMLFLAECGADSALCIPIPRVSRSLTALYYAALMFWMLIPAARPRRTSSDEGRRRIGLDA